jgi:hypothetical protein
LEFKEITSVLTDSEILVRHQHFLCFYAHHFSAVHVLVIDEGGSQLIGIIESDVELIYLGAAKDKGPAQDLENSSF